MAVAAFFQEARSIGNRKEISKTGRMVVNALLLKRRDANLKQVQAWLRNS